VEDVLERGSASSVKEGNRRRLLILVGEEERNYSQEMVAKIDYGAGEEVVSSSIAIVEPVFANIRTNKRLDALPCEGSSR